MERTRRSRQTMAVKEAVAVDGMRETFVPSVARIESEVKPPLEENVSYGKVQYPEDHRPKRETQEWDTIRIEIVYDPTVEKLTPARREILEQLIINARDYFESTLMVHRLSSIELTPKCIGTKTVLPNGIIECGEDCEQRCGEAVVSKAEYFLKCICNGARCRRAQGGGGGKDADFILFVSVRSKNCIANSLAYATHCALDEKTGRPIAGHVNICPDSFNHMMANELSQWESTIKHELIHVFVFSPSLFKKFPGAKQKWINDDGTIPGVIQRITRMDWETASGMIEHDVYMIATPKVRNEARKYFSCSSLEGAELENQGGRGTSLSHWEKRVFENEAMSGVSTQVFAISRLTLALFEDSGWYKANYEKADEMAWGHGLGCAFAKKSCLSWMLSHRVDPYPFCTVYEDARCATDRLAKLSCNMAANLVNVPDEYNYNIGGLYTDMRGKVVNGYGRVEVADYCPYYRVVGEYSREDSDTRCTYPGNMHYNNYSLEVFSPTARCFELKSGVVVKNEGRRVTWIKNVGCYESTCRENLVFIKTQKSKFYPCYYQGQLIHVEKRIRGVGTITMQIVCPSCSELCGRQHCAPDRLVRERIGDPTRSAPRALIRMPLLTLSMLFLFS